MNLKYIIASLFLLSFQFSIAQKLNRSTKKKVKRQMEELLKQDQLYRSSLMLGELDQHKLDSLNHLPTKLFWERVEQFDKGELGFNKTTKDSLWKLQNALDEQITLKFIGIIKQYGYPSFKRTGFLSADVISLHQIGIEKFKKVAAVFDQELKKGNMPPDEYAMWYDRNLLDSGKKQLYGAYNSAFPCVENIEVTNKERQKIGLRVLRENKCN